uniref:Uncharacterized protein n=1 Tax=Lactuca sativa TaxID=4236 RepID=A0A9R1V7B7_LACSA|nr:hypothetical protein LSAT_V11C600314040 [Lactuca sativa]
MRDREDLRKKLNSKMKKVVDLTVRDCNKAVRMLSKNDELMVIFFTVEDEDKFEWVKDLLEDDGVDPFGGDTTKTLEDKHPYKPPPSMPNTIFSESPLIMDVNSVLGELNPSLTVPRIGETG